MHPLSRFSIQPVAWLSFVIWGLVAASGTPHAEIQHPEFSAEEVAFFENEVRPILTENCTRCHGGLDAKGKVRVRSGLQLISRRGLVVGGDHGSAIDLNDAPASLLLKAVSYRDAELEMPPSGKLPEAQLVVLEKWVAMKAPWTPEDIDAVVEIEEDDSMTKVNETTRAFWSNRPLQTPEVPALDGEAGLREWVANPVDLSLIHI